MILKLSVVLLSSVFLSAFGNQQSIRCNSELHAKQDLNVDKYLGKWYLITTFFVGDTPTNRSLEAPCTHVVISRYENGTLRADGFDAELPHKNTLFMRNLTNSQDGKFEYDFDGKVVPHNIIDTDYVNYAIWHDCRFIFGNYVDLVTVLSRTTTLNNDIREEIYAIIEKHVEKSKLKFTFKKCGDCDDLTTSLDEACKPREENQP